MISLPNKLLIGRILTRSGDQAWDFAVPLVLLKLMPGELRIAAFYYLLVRLVMVVFLPRITALIDRMNRFNAARIGILIQLIGVFVGFVAVYGISIVDTNGVYFNNWKAISIFGSLVLGGILSSTGSSFMDIAIANDLVPSSLAESELASFNSRLRQVDLFTELTAPILAGLLLVLELPQFLLFGFALIALWNLLSFFPEYALLKSIFKSRPDLLSKNIQVDSAVKISFIQKLKAGWCDFFKEPVALAVLAYAILWLSALSPHGVLLTAFLKDGWKLPEWAIGTFRGLGGFFGLAATLIFPMIKAKLGLARASLCFLLFQTAMVLLALFCFLHAGQMAQIGFLVFILFSRIGLYGFSLGEMQIRQVGVKPSVRGEVNGFASALTAVATLGLFSAGALLPATSDFGVLIIGSVCMVFLAAVVFSLWNRRHGYDFK